jgi:hypothetical protein
MSRGRKVVKVGKSPGMNFEVRLGVEPSDYGSSLPYLRITLLSHYIKVHFPAWVLRPHRVWVDTSKYSWGSPRGGFWDEHRREFGVYLYENHFNVLYGPQTDDSSTEKRWSCFLPWSEWRLVCLEFYDDLCLQFAEFDYEKIEKQTKNLDAKKRREFFFEVYKAESDCKQQCPKMHCTVKDFDGQQVDVQATVVERTWKKGVGLFKWVSWFVPTKRIRFLEIDFSTEIGPEKHSWKGGTLSTSIVMEDGENHDDAFLRFMKANRMTDFQSRNKLENM